MSSIIEHTIVESRDAVALSERHRLIIYWETADAA